MTLSSLVVSRDWAEVSVLECVLGGLHIGVDVEPELERARAKLAKSKIDALIVDRDLEGASNFLRGLENSLNTVPLVIISGAKRRAKEAGAPFVFEKPISVEQAVRTLSAARNMILDGRLRYHRQSLNLPISLTNSSKRRLNAHLLNVSQGGVGVRLNGAANLTGTIRLGFALPGSKLPLKLHGEVAWTDGRGNAGIRFVEVNRRVKQNLQLWLAQQYLMH
jgi:DNA-binding NtrC family response regulator